MTHTICPELDDLQQATGAHEALRVRLAEMSLLSEHQRAQPDDVGAMPARLQRKQALLREIEELGAGRLFARSRRLATPQAGDGAAMTQARTQLRAAAEHSLQLWGQLAASEEAAVAACASRVNELRRQLVDLGRASNLRGAYGAGSARLTPVPRFLDHRR